MNISSEEFFRNYFNNFQYGGAEPEPKTVTFLGFEMSPTNRNITIGLIIALIIVIIVAIIMAVKGNSKNKSERAADSTTKSTIDRATQREGEISSKEAENDKIVIRDPTSELTEIRNKMNIINELKKLLGKQKGDLEDLRFIARRCEGFIYREDNPEICDDDLSSKQTYSELILGIDEKINLLQDEYDILQEYIDDINDV